MTSATVHLIDPVKAIRKLLWRPLCGIGNQQALAVTIRHRRKATWKKCLRYSQGKDRA